MRIIRSISAMQRFARKLAAQNKSIGLVPTMGFLHEGHLSLIERVKKATDVVVTTIFVNPAQFGPEEDLDNYPRSERSDVRMIKSAGGEIVFIPAAETMYPKGFQTGVSVEKLTQVLEGACRPTHFDGVTTVVSKLFNIVRPDVAIFGMKDYQQAMVLKQMTKDLGYPIKFIIAPTVREKDGLAMSSRNSYFNPDQRREAACLYRALRTGRAMALAGITSCLRIEREMRLVIESHCRSAKIEYIAFTDFNTLKPIRRVTKGCICSLAVRVHSVRLIDNLKLA